MASTGDEFPVGLKVLVVDDDVVCLRILHQMLRRCSYQVTTCTQATVALNLLRERRGSFDIVLSDVHMPDMDGFKLLELIGLEMDLPVIMMSSDGRTNVVMRGVQHGACDYLIKPIRDEELRNIWQHVVRKRSIKEHEYSGSLDDNNQHKRGSDDAECASSVIEGADGVKPQKKKRDAKEEDDTEIENDERITAKKPRVVWSVELHQQFVSAVNQLGIKDAVPTRILELMNVPGLTRDNVASHLQENQKFRLYLKRLDGVAQQQGGLPSIFCGPSEQNPKLGSLGRFDIQAQAASGQLSPETLTALHAQLLGRSTSSVALPAVVEQPHLLQASLQQVKCMPADQVMAYSQPLMKWPPSISNSKHLSQPIISAEDVHSGYGSWLTKTRCMVPGSNLTGLAAPDSNMLVAMMQQRQWQKQQQLEQQQKQSGPSETNRSINVKPSCIVLPSQLPDNFQVGDSPASSNQACSLSKSSVIDYSVLSSQSNNSSGVVQVFDGEFKTACGLNRHCSAGSLSPSVSASSAYADNSFGLQHPNSSSVFGTSKQLPGLPNHLGSPVSYSSRSSQVLYPGIGKGASIPSRFAVDESGSPMCNLNTSNIYPEDTTVKQELNMNIMENAKAGASIFQKFSPGDLTSVFSD